MLSKLKAIFKPSKNGMEGQPVNAGEPEQMTLQEEAWDLVKTVLLAVTIVLILRMVIFQTFNIPTGSMKPGLQVGDFIFVTKYEYGYSRASLIYPFTRMNWHGRIFGSSPKAGEVVVFKNSRVHNQDYIKRVIGVPGDEIRTINGELYINGERVQREYLDNDTSNCRYTRPGAARYIETLPNGVSYIVLECLANQNRLDNVGPFYVPKGHFFTMGDNRDDSLDSRTDNVGMVPLDQIVGKAHRIVFSVDGSNMHFWEIWKFPFAIRYSRIFDPIS